MHGRFFEKIYCSLSVVHCHLTMYENVSQNDLFHLTDFMEILHMCSPGLA
jgi:hypothetical protein